MWHQRFATYICKHGFSTAKSDTSLFIYKDQDDVAYLLLYVDDIVLTTSSPALLRRITNRLNSSSPRQILALSITSLASLSHDPLPNSTCPKDSMTSTFFSGLAWLSVTLRQHQLTPSPSCLPLMEVQLRALQNTRVLLAPCSISR